MHRNTYKQFIIFLLFCVYTISLVAAAPASPIYLTAASSSSTQIELTWVDNADDETGFVVERSVDGLGGWGLIGTPGVNITSFSDSLVNLGDTWYYRVKADDGAAGSAYSNVFGTTAFDQLPGTAWDWHGDMSPTSEWLIDVVWNGSFFVAVGNNGIVMTSVDGMAWTTQSSGTTEALHSITWDGTQFVAVGGDDSPVESRVIMTSPDGITWTFQAGISPAGTQIDIAWDGTQYVVVGRYGKIQTSPDGFIWTQQSKGTANELRAVSSNGSILVAAGVWGDFYNNGEIVTSTDGVTWDLQVGGIINGFSDIVWTGSQFVVVGGDFPFASGIHTSPDGINWSTQAAGTTNYLHGVTWNGTQYVAVGYDGTVITSADAISWTTQTSVTSNTLQDIAWNGSLYVAVGGIDLPVEASEIITSPDGIIWTTQAAGSTSYLQGIAWSGTQFVAVGYSGTVITSPDGFIWTTQTSGTATYLAGVTWTGSRFAAIGGNDVITSADGFTWTLQSTGTSGTWYNDISWDGTRFVAVGAAAGSLSAIITSTGSLASLTSYAQWVTNSNFGALDSSELADPDSDGVVNAIEYALDFEPTSISNANNMPAGILNGGMLDFTFTRVRDDTLVTYTVQTSTDLVTWVDEFVNPGNAGSEVTVSKSIPNFMRLKVNIQ